MCIEKKIIKKKYIYILQKKLLNKEIFERILSLFERILLVFSIIITNFIR